MTSPAAPGLMLRAYLALRPALQPLMRVILRRRVAQGKDTQARAGEKLGHATLARPGGTLVWLHAVGLGEVLALRPLILAMSEQRPDLSFLITSTARSSAKVAGANLPPNTLHQFLPLDGPNFVNAFLDHWRPDLAVWSEQDVWPGAVMDIANREIPQAYINARITAEGFRRRARLGRLNSDILSRFLLVGSQNQETVHFLAQLGANDVQLFPSLKPAAPALVHDPDSLRNLQTGLSGRKVWVAASTHEGDEAVALAAQSHIFAEDPARLLILAPRIPARASEIAAELNRLNISFAQRSKNDRMDASTAVYLADTFGELGLWYRLADHALIGNSFQGRGGHNPWEAICLGVPVICGPDTQNFEDDYDQVDSAGLLTRIIDKSNPADQLAQTVARLHDSTVQTKAKALVAQAHDGLSPLAAKLVSLIKTPS
ncbi:glycosyltransferase N-terminal domain-containing protein [Shimia sp.]|uniref:3-deoxy-D-manno-octulosonic acid transferase n=1 Tax=Shimia sp. TaxID=1954381 RepID=UPI003299CC87